MLLPWALCGWILVAAILASRRPAPRWIAVLALLFATAGGVNSTALLMISPLPVLWFISAARMGDMSWRRAAGMSVATAVASAGAGAWLVASAVAEPIADTAFRTEWKLSVSAAVNDWPESGADGQGRRTTEI